MNPKTKESMFFSLFSILVLVALFLFWKHAERNAPPVTPLPIESRYDLNILAKKHGIPLPVAKELSLRRIRIKTESGNSNWKASIEKASEKTGVPENVIGAFLVDMELIYTNSESYGELE